jgi:type II secretory pathway predicted ATPase ExeA
MDLAYWGFQRWPFERSFAADRFFASPLHEEALARLLFLVEESRRSGMIMGQGGTGKTFLLKLLQQRAERLGRVTARCEATTLDGSELAGQIAAACHAGCDPDASPARIWSSLQGRFAAMALIKQPLVIIIDHFDLVEFSCQQAVRRLHQLADATEAKLTVILATRDRIVPTALQDVVELRVDVAPWTLSETSDFIHSAIQNAGSAAMLFDDEAINAIHDATWGVPATTVSLASLSLLAAMGQDEMSVTREFVEAAAMELLPRATDPRLKPRVMAGPPLATSNR